MKLSSKLYDILKWIAIICLPALGVCYKGLATVWNLPFGSEIQTTLDIMGTLLGTLLGISCYNYAKVQNTKDDIGIE